MCVCLCEKNMAKCLTPGCGDLATVFRCSYSWNYIAGAVAGTVFRCPGRRRRRELQKLIIKYFTTDCGVSSCFACSLELSLFSFFVVG